MNVPGQKSNHSDFAMMHITNVMIPHQIPRLPNTGLNLLSVMIVIPHKTSTGFSTAGATFEDVKLMHDHVGEGVKVKAAGGISSFDDAEKFMSLGADRLGTSRLVKIMKNTDNGAGY